MTNQRLLADFERELKRTGKSKNTIRCYLNMCRSFLGFIGEQDVRLLTAETVKAFFDRGKLAKLSVRSYTNAIAEFLRFVAKHAPAPRARSLPAAEKPQPTGAATLALRDAWAADRRKEQADAGDDLVAKLGRKLIDHYLYFQSRLSGAPDSVDELNRLSDECRELLQKHLPLFLSLSAQGRNIHPKIDERAHHERRSLDKEI